jgi:hypothetical protein
MPHGFKVGGRKKGSKNKIIPGRQAKYLPKEIALEIRERDAAGERMIDIQLDMARMITRYAKTEEALGNKADAMKYASVAAKIAHDASSFLYPTHAAVRHAGEEDAPPIRIESLSDFQLEKLIERLSKR